MLRTSIERLFTGTVTVAGYCSFNLLISGYRFNSDQIHILNCQTWDKSEHPLCIVCKVDNYERLYELSKEEHPSYDR